MIDLSISCRTYLKTGVPRVPRVPPVKNNDTSVSCIKGTRNTNEKRRCSTCSAGTPRTRTEHTGVPQCIYSNHCKYVRKRTRNTGNTENTKKKKDPTSFQDVKIEPNPKPYIKDGCELVIPLNVPVKYRWWAGGQSIFETLLELDASDSVVEHYIGPITSPADWRKWQKILEERIAA